MQLASRQSAVVRPKRGAAIRSTQDGNQKDAGRLARRALHTVVSRGVSACATSPLALRQAPARRPGPACRGSPVHALRAHRLLARGRCLPSASRGYSTAARALVGKSYAPSAPRAGQGTPQQKTAEGLRLAVVDELRPRCSWSEARAQLSSCSRSPKGAVPDPHASRAPSGRLSSCRCC
jgi:hypothetical protein